MKKGLLVLLIAVIPTLMPNLASAIAIDVESGFHIHGLQGGIIGSNKEGGWNIPIEDMDFDN